MYKVVKIKDVSYGVHLTKKTEEIIAKIPFVEVLDWREDNEYPTNFLKDNEVLQTVVLELIKKSEADEEEIKTLRCGWPCY